MGKFGVYNHYAEEWWTGDDGKPALFDSRNKALDWRYQMNKSEPKQLDLKEGEVIHYTGDDNE